MPPQRHISPAPARARRDAALRTPTRTPTRTTVSVPSMAASQVAAEIGRYAASWLKDYQPYDPIFKSESVVKALQQKIGQPFQPYAHCEQKLYPTVAVKFGLERFVPQAPLPLASRGPGCVVDSARVRCHAHTLPAFLYTSTQMSCNYCQKHGFPTLVYAYKIKSITTPSGRLSELSPLSCWVCYTKGVSNCNIPNVTLTESDSESEYTPQTPFVKDASLAGDVASQSGESIRPLNTKRLSSPRAFLSLLRSRVASAPLPTRELSPGAVSPSPAPSVRRPPTPDLRRAHVYKEVLLAARKRSRTTEPTRSPSIPPVPPLPPFVTPKFSTMQLVTAAAAVPPRSPRGSVSPRSIASVAPQSKLLAYRSDIEDSFEEAVNISDDQRRRLGRTQARMTGTVDKLFALCQSLEEQASADRQAIDSVRQERDRFQASLRTLDQRLGNYSKLVKEKDRTLETLRGKVAYLEGSLDELHQQQLAVDERVAGAALERDKADNNAARMKHLMEEALASKELSDDALLDALDEVEEVKSKIAEFERSNLSLKRQLAAYEAGTFHRKKDLQDPTLQSQDALEQEQEKVQDPERDQDHGNDRDHDLNYEQQQTQIQVQNETEAPTQTDNALMQSQQPEPNQNGPDGQPGEASLLLSTAR
ncbi:hypothetical protein BCR39DRAFT_503518 [Naematelia encephala]|uniref:Uncharacterized protein n=1 Tax=Naematelia encephala TaxID=71784 RepID=A0A1Y2BJX9_9TREE|nr:hypothetical protein BCR39DRAFT_503518 [Naematelia encephala]